MSGYIEGKINAKQYSFLPTCYDEIISEDNPVRILEAFVDSLDMKQLNFKNSDRKNNKAGRPSYNPKDLLKLYLYGYFNGIRSSRKLEKECEISGFIDTTREQKTMLFIVLRDRSGKIQVAIEKKKMPEVAEKVASLLKDSVVRVKGAAIFTTNIGVC